MDLHIYMGYCSWEAFKTLARNYFLVDDHELFPEIQKLLSTVEVTPAEATEMLLRSEDADVALQGFVEFLQDKKKKLGRRRSKK
jgi:chaperone BCS1